MLFALMKEVIVAIAKLWVRTTVAEPSTTVLNTLIDFVTRQQSAAQKTLERIEGKIDDLHQNPFRVGSQNLKDARLVLDPDLKRDRIQRALDDFIKASQYTRYSDPLLHLSARLCAGACYDLLHESWAALNAYEEVFRGAMKFEQIVLLRMQNKKQGIWELMDGLFASRQPRSREGQQLEEALVRNQVELRDFIQSLLQLIANRKGISPQAYLVQWAGGGAHAKGRKVVRLVRAASPGRKSSRVAKTSSSLLRGVRSIRHSRVCLICGQPRTFGSCPVCHGEKKIKGAKCKRCNGIGTAYVCGCDNLLR